MENDFIELSKVKVHNLKNIDLKIPKNKLIVICGLSGSGKSSLAFDTIYAEGQRRYLESLSSYARQFLGGYKKPDVEKIEGLSPTIAVNQKTISANPRSTVGTLTEIHDYLRLLFAYIGKPYCYNCGRLLSSQTPNQIADYLFEKAKNGWVSIFAPVIIGKKGEHRGVIEEIQREGWPQIKIDGVSYLIEETKDLILDKKKSHNIDVLIDRVNLKDYKISQNDSPKGKIEKKAAGLKKKKIKNLLREEKERILDSVKKGLKMGKGKIKVEFSEGKIVKQEIFSTYMVCPDCQISIPKIEPRLFSFNSPYGACPTCQGLGKLKKVDPDLILNPKLSLNEGAILPWFALSRFSRRALQVPLLQWQLENLSQKFNFSLDIPFKDLPQKIQQIILYGGEGFDGIIPKIEKLYLETSSEYIRDEISKYVREIICPDCQGARLKKEVLAIKINNKNIFELTSLPVSEEVEFFKNLEKTLSLREQKIAQPLLKEIIKKLHFLLDVGVDYINLAREAATLSVGENQRIRLACQLGSGLSGIIYVLDEPTIGLHQRDIARLIKALKELVELKNTVIVVEHDKSVIESADWVIEIGPGAGENGGRVVFEGTYPQLLKAKTLTGLYLKGDLKVEASFPHKEVNKETKWLKLIGANQFNLKNVNLKIPLEKFICVAGVSGSGKSTLIIETLAKVLFQKVNRQKVIPGKFKAIEGVENIDKVILVDQGSIGKTPRSNPATYTNVFNPIRQLFAQTYQARLRGYTPSFFSFNTKAGRCPVCAGEGFQKIEMYFLPDIYVECEACEGKRYSPEVLKIEYHGKNIADILDLSISQAKKEFSDIPQVREKLQVLEDIGLGYIKLGQGAPSLSGGEAQRIKLAYELSKKSWGHTLYILDEPTVGLHFDDIRKLLIILRKLVEKENTVVVIEHNPDFIKSADWVIELGPEGGEKGGRIVFEGTPEMLKSANTVTAKFLT